MVKLKEFLKYGAKHKKRLVFYLYMDDYYKEK